MKKKISVVFLVSLFFSSALPFAISYYKRVLYQPYLTVMGFANMSDGIGRQSVEIMDTMREVVSVGYRPTNDTTSYIDVPPAVQTIMKQRRSKLGKIVLYEDIFYPFSHLFFEKRFDLNRKDQIRLAYSMFESSQIPKLWVNNLNRYFDAVVVPDPYHISSYQDSGVTIPIFVLPLGLNLKKLLEEPIKTSVHSPFVFANFSTCILRKNHQLLIKAFYKAFGNDPTVKLWINSKYTEDHLFDILKDEIKALGVTNILLTNHCYDNASYIQNFHTIDCYVSLSQSEGFSIQPREAMALGIPCIVSDNTAQSTICKSGLVKSVPCSVKEPAYYENFKDVFGFRYAVDLDETIQALKDMRFNYGDYLAQSEKLRKWASQYNYEKLRPLYKSLIKPKKIVLGEENRIEENILITNSKALYTKYKTI